MLLTEQQETAIIKEYTGLMHHIAWRFERKRGTKFDCHDDLFQECSIVLLTTIREMESIEDLKTHFPFWQMQHAMCIFLLTLQTLSHPKRTTDFFQSLDQDRIAKDRSENLHQMFSSYDQQKAIDDEITVRDFINALPERDQCIVRGKQDGEKSYEIGKSLGRCESWVSKRLKAISRDYISSVS